MVAKAGGNTVNFWQLSIFVSVVEHESFSRASNAINLSQPTVSSHIKELESYFDTRLLDRMGKKTQPTRAGRILYEHAKELLNLKDIAELSLVNFLDKTKGRLSIGGSTIPSGYIFPKLIGPFLDEYPGINFQLCTGDTMQVVEKIKTGEVEAGIVGAEIDDPLIRQDKLLADQMRLIVHPEHPLAEKEIVEYEDLAEYRMIGREEGSGTWQSVLSGIRQAGFDDTLLNTKLTMGNTISVIQAILNGVGISILSTVAVKDELAQERLKTLTINHLNLERYFYITFPVKRSLSPICESFIDFARSCFFNTAKQRTPALQNF